MFYFGIPYQLKAVEEMHRMEETPDENENQEEAEEEEVLYLCFSWSSLCSDREETNPAGYLLTRGLISLTGDSAFSEPLSVPLVTVTVFKTRIGSVLMPREPHKYPLTSKDV